MTNHQKIVQEIIPAKLKEIEARENIRVIHCVESGSRVWGFASPDSDYDVRFIYVRPIEYYLRLDKTWDVIEWQLDDTLDIQNIPCLSIHLRQLGGHQYKCPNR